MRIIAVVMEEERLVQEVRASAVFVTRGVVASSSLRSAPPI